VTTVLVIAGTDSSGGAGLTRDVATLTHLGAEAQCVVTAVTAQTDRELTAVELLPPSLVQAQIRAALATRRAGAIKIGMLGSGAIVEAVADSLPPPARLPLVVDPVLAASSGAELLDRPGRVALMQRLLPRVTLLTPNLEEAAVLLASATASADAEIVAQGQALCARGAAAVLLKGGHASGPLATDWLITREGCVRQFSVSRLVAQRRGTGCALAAAIAAGLASGLALDAACAQAKAHVTELLQTAR